jgi:glycosyltransferase involved in cell wall biosynthesis
MLDIVITHYDEPFEVGEKLFRMIALQRCVDFEQIRVMVVNDGGNRLPEDKLSGLPYPVEQIDIKHGGISAARNAGIDHATGRWIMFCDFDDNFASIFSLREIMNLLNTDDYDMLWCRIVAEDYVSGKELLYYVPAKQRFVFCHGKVYRVQFLKEAGIRFREDLVFNEDSCFNAIIIAHTPHTRIGEISSPVPIYSWIRRPHSVTNSGREDEASYGHFRRNMIVTEEYQSTGDTRYYGMLTRTVYDTYYMVFGKRNSMQMRRRILDEFTPWIAERIEAFGQVDNDDLAEIRSIARMELVEPDELIPDDFERISRWVKSIVDIYRKANKEEVQQI